MKLTEEAKQMIEEIKKNDKASYAIVVTTSQGTQTCVQANQVDAVKMLVTFEEGVKNAYKQTDFPLPFEAMKRIVQMISKDADRGMKIKKIKED